MPNEDAYITELNEARRDAAPAEKPTEKAAKASAKNVSASAAAAALVAFGIELIPFGDILPSFTGSVVFVYIRLKAAGHDPNPAEFLMMGMVAAINDSLDWLIIGSIPIVGDIFDGIMTTVLGSWQWLASKRS